MQSTSFDSTIIGSMADHMGEEGEENALLIHATPDPYEAATELLEQWGKGNLSAAVPKLAKAVYKANPKLPGRG